MKTQEMFNYVRNEWQQAWHGMSDQWNHFRQRTNHALVSFHPDPERTFPKGNDKYNVWGLVAADMFDMENKLVLRMEAAGLNPDAIDVTVDGNELVVNGEKILSADICDNAGKCHFSEISYGRVERRFALPVRKVAEDNNSASYNNGILTIEIPYAEMAAKQARNISVH